MPSVAAGIDALSLPLSLFNGANEKANSGQRNSLATRVQSAATHQCDGQQQGAIAHLNAVLEKIDGVDPTPDWMVASPEKTALKETIELPILLTLLLG